MNSVKDVPRGTANCDLLQEGRNESDHSHVSKMTPLAVKKRELENDPQYQAIDKGREKRTTAKRQSKDGVRPL
jgi:hypothetical protein